MIAPKMIAKLLPVLTANVHARSARTKARCANLPSSAISAKPATAGDATESFGVRADSIVEEGKFTLADAYLKKRPATDLELDFGDRFGGNLTLLPGHRGLSSVPLKLESELQIAIADGEKILWMRTRREGSNGFGFENLSMPCGGNVT
jgi:hypothetical protein